ncbi:MAG: hypothetical protein LBT89_05990 [Planctomycetaceae bacterium]|jgi:hypothetical protein|nr:hypothetical protein [Planctomycetaceae bacterium]
MRLLLNFALLCAVTFAAAAPKGLQAEEQDLKPFLTIQAAGVDTIISIIERFAGILIDEDTVKKNLAPFKNLQGINSKGNISLALRSTENNELELFAFLPITDIEKAGIPGAEPVFDTIRAALTKNGNAYSYKSPLGNYTVIQKMNYVVAAPEKAIAAVPADPKKLFPEFEKQTFGTKLNFENTSPEALETILAPLGMLMTMAGNENAGEAFEMIHKALKKGFNEYSSLSVVYAVDAKSLDITATISVAAKKGSSTDKKIAAQKNMKTAFNAFAGNPAKTIFSYNAANYISESEREEAKEAIDTLTDAFSEGFFEGLAGTIDEDDEKAVESFQKTAERITDSVKKILLATIAKDTADFGASLDADGTALLAFTLGETDALIQLVRDGIKLAQQAAGSKIDFDVKKYVTNDYETVAGYKVSKIIVPVKDIIAAGGGKVNDDIPAMVKAMTLGGFWAVKKNEAVAAAFGFDIDKTEKTFKAALEATTAPVKLPPAAMTLSARPIGKFLQQFVVPMIPADLPDAEPLRQIAGSLAKADEDAKIEMLVNYAGTSAVSTVKISGKLVEVIVKAIGDNAKKTLNRGEIRDL